MSSKSKRGQREEEPLQLGRGMWGWLAGLITLVVIAFPLSAAIAYATHPATRKLFGGHLSNTSTVGFSVFWWILALLLIALPLLVGYGVARLSPRLLTILGVILGQMFAF